MKVDLAIDMSPFVPADPEAVQVALVTIGIAIACALGLAIYTTLRFTASPVEQQRNDGFGV